MAGDWIKMRMDLPEDPAVYKLAALTKLDRLSVVGRLYAFWAWADKHAVDGRVDGASSQVVDDITRLDGFAAALVSVRWLEIGDDFIALPHHERHNGESAKERGLKNARQARWREGKDNVPPTNVDAPPSTKASTREEKRREEKNNTSEPVGSGASAPRPPARSAGLPPDDKDLVFANGVALLTSAGVKESNARSFLAAQCKAHGDAAVRTALDRCASERPVQPVPWLTATLGASPSRPRKSDSLMAGNIAAAQRFMETTHD